MFKVLTLDNISVAGLERLPRDIYEVASEIQRPDAVLVRSQNMHDIELPASVKAVARAGAGVNNIPIAKMTERGIPVFNAPGANANAVKELTIAGMLLAARNICQAWNFSRELAGDKANFEKKVEAGKKRYVGFELPGRTLGVIGLGAIGVSVANSAIALGMRVVGLDPQMTVTRAWQLSAEVTQVVSMGDLLAQSDFVSVHVPMSDGTRALIDEARLGQMQRGATLLNFSRGPIVDEPAVLAALDSGALHAYVCDFPSPALGAHDRVTALPHIGASTREAEEKCAVMVADQLRDFLEHGNVENAVNFPAVSMPRNGGYRLAVANVNVPNMLGQVSTALAAANLNIIDMLNKSRGEIAYTLADVEKPVPDSVLEQIRQIDGVRSVRAFG